MGRAWRTLTVSSSARRSRSRAFSVALRRSASRAAASARCCARSSFLRLAVSACSGEGRARGVRDGAKRRRGARGARWVRLTAPRAA
eukprot:4652916-Prymnesium_polylepis.1